MNALSRAEAEGWATWLAQGFALALERARRIGALRVQVSAAVPFVVILLVALWSRYRFAAGSYNYNFGSGDAHLILTKALFIARGVLTPPAELAPADSVFDQPPLIPLVLAAFSRLFDTPLDLAPFIVVPALTCAALLAFFILLRRIFDLPTALMGAVLTALLPRLSFDSTEPEKAPFVVSFFIVSLLLLYLGQERRPLLVFAGVFMGLAVFSHTSAYLFLPVFVLSQLALSRFQLRRTFDRHFLASLVPSALMVAAYVVLAKAFAPGEALSGQTDEGTTLLPSFVQHYWDTLSGLAGHGFTQSAWNRYFDGIRRELTTPVYVLAIAGFAVGAARAWRGRRYEIVPLLLWMVIVTLGFAIQYPAFSHGSRYPSYVTPAFVAMAAFFVVWAARLAARWVSRRRWRPGLTTALVGAFVAFAALTYATTPNPGLRQIYGGHRDLANYFVTSHALDDGSHLLYLGWPSITFYLLEQDMKYKDQLHTFGWGLRDLDTLTPAFIERNNIRYYAYDHSGVDYYQSSDKVLEELSKRYWLKRMGKFERGAGNYIILFQLHPLAH